MTEPVSEMRKRRFKRAALWLLMVLSVPLYWRADHVWGDCGYDCPLFGYDDSDSLGWGPITMPTLYFAVIAFLVCAAWLVVGHVSEWRQKQSGR